MSLENDRFERPFDSSAVLARAQAGDDAAFDAIVQHYETELRGIALFLTGQSSDADDVLQETFIAAYEGLSAFEARASLKTWLTRILFRRAARHVRSQRVRRAAQPLQLSQASREILNGAVQGSSTAGLEIRQDVLEALQMLDAEHREVLVLRELQGLSYREIAAVLEIPDGTVESRIYRARQELKERLKDYLD